MNNITEDQRHLLYEAWAYCDWKDKSTEFMVQYMADSADVDHDTVMDFLWDSTKEERSEWYKNNQGWHEKYES